MPVNNSSQEARSLGVGLDALAQQLNATAEAIRSCTTSLDDLDDERARVVNAAEALLKDINPADPVMTSMISMVQFTAIRLFVGWKAFDIMASAGTISVADLAGKLAADVSLIRRRPSSKLFNKNLREFRSPHWHSHIHRGPEATRQRQLVDDAGQHVLCFV